MPRKTLRRGCCRLGRGGSHGVDPLHKPSDGLAELVRVGHDRLLRGRQPFLGPRHLRAKAFGRPFGGGGIAVPELLVGGEPPPAVRGGLQFRLDVGP